MKDPIVQTNRGSYTLPLMITVIIYSTTKTKDSWLTQAIEEYEKRLSSHVKIEWLLMKDQKKILSSLGRNRFIVLDLHGEQYSSESFSSLLEKECESYGATLRFVIGDDLGLDEELQKKASFRFCLSKLTFTHQICRLLLIEQLYRAFEIMKGSHYHK